MAQSKNEIRAMLSSAELAPRKRFGQNFMIDQNLLRVVADAGEIKPNDLVIEVGPGTGSLTEELLARGALVIAVEIDRDLAKLLRERFGSVREFELIEGDALEGKYSLNPQLASRLMSAKPQGAVKLVANLPYNIASPLVIELLIIGVDLLAFTVQKEVADRLRAAAGSDAYGPLSVMAQMLARVELLRTIPPQAFWPAPKVDSALVRMTRSDQLREKARPFGEFVRLLFSARRKMLRRALEQIGVDAAVALGAAKIDSQLRPEALTPRQLLDLFDAAKPKAERDRSR